MTKEEYILKNRTANVRQLALQKVPEGLSRDDMRYCLEQIDGWQRARRKLPRWAEADGVIFPPHISMEQCSSEATAMYKAKVVASHLSSQEPTVMADLTGGFGVDFSYLAPLFAKAIYIERQDHLCRIAHHNMPLLGIENADIQCADSEDVLESLPKLDLLFLDPARRDSDGRKTYAITDCTPDVVRLLPQLLATLKPEGRMMLKLSPMLDIHEALRQLPGATEVHVVSTGGECKELLIVIENTVPSEQKDIDLFCVNDSAVFHTTVYPLFNPSDHQTANPSNHLFLPNASIMKAGCFGQLQKAFALLQADPNSHVFFPTPQTDIEELSKHGRMLTVTAVTTMNKQSLRKALQGITQANITCRNFPLTPQQLRQRLRLKDGGNTYIIALTANGEHLLYICH